MTIAPASRRTAPARQAAASAAPARTPRHRDSAIDLVRAVCVAGVVLLHAIMVGVTVVDGFPVFENASEGADWITPLSWVLQVMPMFFVIGGFSGYLAHRRMRERGGSAAGFVAGRIHRLLLPAAVVIGFVAVALALLGVAGVPPELIAVAGFRYSQPLWFLGVFLLCQALLPALAAVHERAPLRTIGVLTVAAVSVDILRAASGIDALGFLNLGFVWLALQQLGFFLADGSIDALSRRVRIVAGLAAVAALVLTFIGGVYSADLVANINPPTAALLLVGVAHTSAFSLFRRELEDFSRRPRPAAFTRFVTRRAMTIYLWHMPVLLAMAGASALFAVTTGIALPEPSSVGWWLTRPAWLVVALALTALVAVIFTGVESRAMPAATRSGRRAAAAAVAGSVGVVILLVSGMTVLTACIALILIVVALRLARTRQTLDALPLTPVMPPQRSTSSAA